jgi:hypothetical protein
LWVLPSGAADPRPRRLTRHAIGNSSASSPRSGPADSPSTRAVTFPDALSWRRRCWHPTAASLRRSVRASTPQERIVSTMSARSSRRQLPLSAPIAACKALRTPRLRPPRSAAGRSLRAPNADTGEVHRAAHAFQEGASPARGGFSVMDHVTKQDEPKLLEFCTPPVHRSPRRLPGDHRPGGARRGRTAFHLVELAPGVTIAETVATIGSAVTADWER